MLYPYQEILRPDHPLEAERMPVKRSFKEANQIIIHTDGAICSTAEELSTSEVFRGVVRLYLTGLREQESPLLGPLGLTDPEGTAEADREEKLLVGLLRELGSRTLEEVAAAAAANGRDSLAARLLNPDGRMALSEFAEGLYDFWRGFDRFMVLHSQPGAAAFEQRPYRAFNATIEKLTHTIRSYYRDVGENITGNHPRIYRQVSAGCDVGLIAVPLECLLPPAYREALEGVPFVRQVWIAPPLIIDPPSNKRAGQFQRVDRNPLEGLRLKGREWLCYPAAVGPLVINIYFHQRFIGLGCSLANLFELASDEQVAAGPDAVFVYGAAPDAMWQFGELPTVFFDDADTGLLAGAIPAEDRFGYFGYLKKMVLTLHNIVMMKRGLMPFHGAMVRVVLKSGREATILIIGDTAAGKSESLEAFRLIGGDYIRDMRVVADDMGSLEVDADGRLLGYGTEIGAFVRLDDLQSGYAFGQIDRAVIMSPQKVNARVVLPVTNLHEVLFGYQIDYLLYANNFELVDAEHPVVELLQGVEAALDVFRAGAAMSKGTTTATGLVHSYFANIFGPPQYRDLHEPLAKRIFETAFARGVFVGQLRTRLGVPGMEQEGPREAARALFDMISGQPSGRPPAGQPSGRAGQSGS